MRLTSIKRSFSRRQQYLQTSTRTMLNFSCASLAGIAQLEVCFSFFLTNGRDLTRTHRKCRIMKCILNNLITNFLYIELLNNIKLIYVYNTKISLMRNSRKLFNYSAWRHLFLINLLDTSSHSHL